MDGLTAFANDRNEDQAMNVKPSRGFLRQTTLAGSCRIDGIGLHSGKAVSLTLKAAPAGSGLRVVAPGVESGLSVSWENAVESPLCTTLVAPNGTRISTVEHLLSALAISGVDNALIEMDSHEPPVLDGSAQPFIEAIAEVGLIRQQAQKRAIEILETVEVADSDRLIRLEPYDGFAVDFTVVFPDPAIGRQRWSGEVTESIYRKELASARTFCLRQEVDYMRANNLALGGSLENAVVVDQGKVLNPEGFRFADECVRHKVLDAVGDLKLAGAPILGRLVAVKAGHALTLRLLKALFAQEQAWRWVGPEKRAA